MTYSERVKEQKKELGEILKELVKDGYKCYNQKREDSLYGYIITPSDNVLYIQYDFLGGYKFSFNYIPTKNCGTGCQCLEKGVGKVTKEIVEQAEKEGFAFAIRLKANLYKNSEQWFSKYWDKENLIEVK